MVPTFPTIFTKIIIGTKLAFSAGFTKYIKAFFAHGAAFFRAEHGTVSAHMVVFAVFISHTICAMIAILAKFIKSYTIGTAIAFLAQIGNTAFTTPTYFTSAVHVRKAISTLRTVVFIVAFFTVFITTTAAAAQPILASEFPAIYTFSPITGMYMVMVRAYGE